jgi:hypothetical protein
MAIILSTGLFVRQDSKNYVSSNYLQSIFKENLKNKTCSLQQAGNVLSLKIKSESASNQFINDIETIISQTSEMINPYQLYLCSMGEFELSKSQNPVESNGKKKYAYEFPINHSFKPASMELCNTEIQIKDKSLTEQQKKYIVIMLDLFLGNTMLSLNDDHMASVCRQFGPQAGEYYSGKDWLKYILPGNNWLVNPTKTQIMVEIIRYTIDFVIKNEHKRFWNIEDNFCYGYDNKKLFDTLNYFNKKESKKFYSFTANFLPNYIVRQITNEASEPNTGGNFLFNWISCELTSRNSF